MQIMNAIKVETAILLASVNYDIQLQVVAHTIHSDNEVTREYTFSARNDEDFLSYDTFDTLNEAFDAHHAFMIAEYAQSIYASDDA